MAKRKTDLSTPAKRSRLPKRRDPHWHFHPVSGPGTHLGWRSEFDTWAARYHPPGGKRQVESLGPQPDFETAWAKAVEWFDKKAGTPPSRFTVGHALSNYADHLYDNNPEITYKTSKSRIDKHIRPHFGDKLVEELTSDHIEAWLKKLGGPAGDTDEHRKRRYGANKARSMLMTALNNHTPKEVRKALAADWNTVKPLKGGTASTEPGVFEEAESQRLVNCCAGNFRDLVMFCLGTGARPASEAAKMKVRDIDTRTATWTVREGKTGTRVTYLTKAMVDLLEAVTAGKAQDEFVFTRDDGKPWNRFDMQRPFQAAVARAKLDPEASPYWLRHTHISRQLLNGAIPALVAQNTGTSLTMLQRTYATFLGQDMTAMLERTSTAYERPESNVVTLK